MMCLKRWLLIPCRRVLFAWENPGVPVSEVVEDVLRAFHHPGLRQESCEIHRSMFNTVRKWADENPKRHEFNLVLGSHSVKAGRNHKGENIHDGKTHSHTGGGHDSHGSGLGGYGQAASQIWNKIQTRDMSDMYGGQGTSRGVSPEPAAFSHSNYGYSGHVQGGGGQFLDTSRPGASYGGAAPTMHDPYSSGHSAYQAQDPYGQPPRPVSGGGYNDQGMPGGWEEPQQQGGWSQGPPAQSSGYGGQSSHGGPPQQGGWSQGPPQQQGGWSQGPPPSQGGWSGGDQPMPGGWSGGDQQQGGWSQGGQHQQGGGYGGY